MKIIFLASALFFALSLNAKSPSFSYVEGGYSELHISGDETDYQGFTVKGGWEFTENVFLRGELSIESDTYEDSFGDDITYSLVFAKAGIGYAFKFDNASLYGFLDKTDFNVDYQDSCCDGFYDENYSVTDAITEAGLGYKTFIGEHLIATLEVAHISWDWKFGSHKTVTRGVASLFFKPGIPVEFGLSYDRLDLGFERYVLGARYSF